MLMIHTCNVHCHALNAEEMDLLGVEDNGKWLPFTFLLETIVAIKMATDDESEPIYNCTAVFTANGETYIIDTPYYTFQKIWEGYMLEDDEEDNDLEF